MIAILLYMTVSTIAGMGSDSLPQVDSSPDVFRTIGVYAGFEYLSTDSSDFAGFSVSGIFRPIHWTEIGVGYCLLADENNKYSYVSSQVGLYSPELWRIQLTGGAALDARVPDNSSDCCNEDPLVQSGVSAFAGLDAVLKDNPGGFQYNLRTRVFFRNSSIGRISAGCYILN